MDWVVNGAMFPQERPRLIDLAKRLACRIPSGLILDVGCGDGTFLSLLKPHYQVLGIEPSKCLSEWVRENRGIPVLQGFYDRRSFTECMFDSVAMIQTLEHVHEPAAFLEAAYAHLRPGGILMLEVPSLHAPNFLLWRLTRCRRLVAPPRGFIEGHVNYFTPRTLRMCAERAGFVIDEIVTGRWAAKHAGWKGDLARVIDPLLDMLGIGGILLFAHRP